MERPWSWPEDRGSSGANRLAARFGMPRVVAETMARRGWSDDDAVEAFLNPRLGSLSDPRVLADMDRAVARVWDAVDRGETVFVHGDYDVDGITGTAFLTRTLRAVGATVVPFVPARADGYGLGDAGIGSAVEAGARVLITVDTGVRAFEEVRRAKDRGIDVVILDHHEPGDGLPEAHAVVNPMRGEQGDAFKNLAAVGVAAKFMHAMALSRPGNVIREAYREALPLVALGTVADVVPLTGENRILVKHGLDGFHASAWAGIRALKVMAGLTRQRITATDVAFFVAPRLNAAGRMGEARDALELLLAEDPSEAFRLAEHIESLNLARRKAEREVLEDALERVRLEGEVPPALVLWSDAWPGGVIGIVASRLQERFHRPVFLVAMDGASGRGSARSREGFPLHEALAACDDVLVQHGGHAAAAGFEIERTRLEAFRTRIHELAGGAELDDAPAAFDVDAAVDLEELDAECVTWVERLAPFGRGNPEPLFGCEGMVLSEIPTVVGKRHLKLSVKRGSETLRAIAFNQGARVRELDRGQRIDALFHAGFDTWRGGRSVQLVIRDMRPR